MSEEAERRHAPWAFATPVTPATSPARQNMPSYFRENWDEKAPIYYGARVTAQHEIERIAEAIDFAALGADLLAIMIRERADEVARERLPWKVSDALAMALRYADGPPWESASAAVDELMYVIRTYLGTKATPPFRFADEKRAMPTIKLKEPGDDHA